eukprot:TRINITY_DN10323_c0_g2_i2.p2 TRINITY_DN10323_c0_g2~~TRINITY_DN10323_c0_g2_i2.p2  ORF type:complete len:221 (-),score=-6.67 TRINITY_DN10323_c0_g2_i2:23-646(-)
MCMHVAHVVHLDLGVTFFGVLNCCFNGSQCRCNGSKIIRQQHLCFRFHKKCCYIEVVVIKGALITGVHCTCIFIIMFVHVCVILDIILYAWQVIIVFVCINSIILHMCFIWIIMSSGQTLGVKAQRFRGHTSPHRNVKEKKKQYSFQKILNTNFLLNTKVLLICVNMLIFVCQNIYKYKTITVQCIRPALILGLSVQQPCKNFDFYK